MNAKEFELQLQLQSTLTLVRVMGASNYPLLKDTIVRERELCRNIITHESEADNFLVKVAKELATELTRLDNLHGYR